MVNRNKDMGRFAVEVELTSNADLERATAGDIPGESVRRVTLSGVVDTGATRLVIPESTADFLGLRRSGPVGVRYADGRTAQREMGAGVHLSYAGRSGVFNAVIEPDRESALIGAIVMEDLDLVVDCTTQTLAPRDPDRIISEIE